MGPKDKDIFYEGSGWVLPGMKSAGKICTSSDSSTQLDQPATDIWTFEKSVILKTLKQEFRVMGGGGGVLKNEQKKKYFKKLFS